MAGFLSSDQITKVQNLADTLHTTFARTITVYKNAKKTLIASSGSWNSLYGRTNTGSDSSVAYTAESQTFEARIYYDDMDTSYFRVEFDGTMFIIESDGTPRGFTSNQFYTFVLSPTE